MLATAVALNLEGAPVSVKDEVARDPVASAALAGLNMTNLLSAGLSAMPVDSDGVPFRALFAARNIGLEHSGRLGVYEAPQLTEQYSWLPW